MLISNVCQPMTNCYSLMWYPLYLQSFERPSIFKTILVESDIQKVSAKWPVFSGLSPKIAACLLWIPEPIIGGIFTIACSLPVSVGVQTLQFCNMNNSRNLFVLGFSIFFGLMIEKWIQFYDRSDGDQPFDTGIPDIDELLEVLLSTSMFTSGILGCFFDNVLPG